MDASDTDNLERLLPKLHANLETLHRLSKNRKSPDKSPSEPVVASVASVQAFFDACYDDNATLVVKACLEDGVDPNVVSDEGLVVLLVMSSTVFISGCLQTHIHDIIIGVLC